ncbi:putative quinol monooxygenase [Anaerotignum sp.]|uniref:putative quinol monooxygenase n=1 Tax=Anaerotignum sp. TaxID=2039241 RepID=UPI00332D8945
MIVLIAKNVVAKQNENEYLKLATKMVEETRKEVGCVYYDLVRDTKEEGVFYFVEKYVDQAAVDAHRSSPHFTTYVPLIQQLKEDSQLMQCDVLPI